MSLFTVDFLVPVTRLKALKINSQECESSIGIRASHGLYHQPLSLILTNGRPVPGIGKSIYMSTISNTFLNLLDMG